MKKITEFTEMQTRVIQEKDAAGKWTQKQVHYLAPRPVQNQDIWARLVHYIIDSFFINALLAIVALVIVLIMVSNQEREPVTIAVSMLLFSLFSLIGFPLYYILCEYFFQRTLGKLVMGSIVIDVYGNRPSFGACVLRTLIRLIPLEFISFFIDGKGWHDTWTETFVVSRAEYERLQELLARAANQA